MEKILKKTLIESFDLIFSKEEFITLVKDNILTDDDGVGYPVYDEKYYLNDFPILPSNLRSIPSWVQDIFWVGI